MTWILLTVAVGGLVAVRVRRREPEVDPRRGLAAVATQLARSTRQGLTVPEALRHCAEASPAIAGSARPPRAVGPAGVGAAVGAVSGAVARGIPLAVALATWEEASWAKRPDPGVPCAEDVTLLCAALRLGAEHGGDVAAALDGVAVALLDRADLDEEARALASQATASVVVLCALPLVGTALFALVSPATLSVLVGTPGGWACAGLAVVLDLTAWVVARRMVSVALGRPSPRRPRRGPGHDRWLGGRHQAPTPRALGRSGVGGPA
jgi:Flp pilus assembly protein TadB